MGGDLARGLETVELHRISSPNRPAPSHFSLTSQSNENCPPRKLPPSTVCSFRNGLLEQTVPQIHFPGCAKSDSCLSLGRSIPPSLLTGTFAQSTSTRLQDTSSDYSTQTHSVDRLHPRTPAYWLRTAKPPPPTV